ncbi:MAG: cysteine desulfurase family protein, partial [Planctomycetota bacterium]
SGATESNQLAIFGRANAPDRGKKRHIVTQSSEHHAILDPIEYLEKQDFEVTLLSPDAGGFISPEKVEAALREDTLLVSVMAANNEVGSIQALREIGEVCSRASVDFHTDAAQGAGRFPIDVEAMKIDLLSISAHKYYGPKGVGALYVRRRGRRVRLEPLAFGGGQEQGLRPGTLNVPGIVGLGEASRIAKEELENETTRTRELRDRLWSKVREAIPNAKLNGTDDFDRRLAGNLNVSFPRTDGAALLIGLKDIAASSGSACTTGNVKASYVLQALGVPIDLAASALRLCVGRFNTEEEIDYAAGRIAAVVRELQKRRP